MRGGVSVMAALLLCCFCGCATAQSPLGPAGAPAGEADPAPSAAPPALYRQDGGPVQVLRSVLFYPQAGTHRLIAETKDLPLPAGASYAETLVRAQLTPPVRNDLLRLSPEGTRLLSLEWTGELVTVNLSAEVLGLSEYDRLLLRVALTNTLTELGGISYVSLLVEGMALSCYSLPMGAFTRNTGNLLALQYASEQELDRAHAGPGPSDSTYSRDVALYFADARALRLVPEVRRVELSGADPAECLSSVFEELARGPVDSRSMRRVVPQPQTPFLLTLDTQVVEDELTLYLEFSNELIAFMERQRLPSELVYGAIILTAASFYPEVSKVIMSVNRQQIYSLPGLPSVTNFTRNVFGRFIGRPVTLYFPSRDGSALLPITRALPLADAVLPASLIAELQNGPTSAEDPAAVSAFPPIAYGIRGVTVQGDVAMVDMTSEMAAACRGMTPEAERNLVYSVVNTLCDMTGVRRVQFYVERQSVTSLAGHIDLSGPLLRNPGLVRKQ